MKKRIGSFLLALMMVLAFVAPIAATMIATEETYAATTDAQMLAQAKKTKTNTRYVIVSSYSAHKTKVYDKQNNYKVVKTSNSCGAKDGHTGQYYMNGKHIYDRDGQTKVNGKVVFHEYYVSFYNKDGSASTKCNSIHTVLYKKGSSTAYYNNTKDKIQDSSHLYKYNWSGGCTRTNNAFAKWVYQNCRKGTGYYIMK